MVEVVGVGGRRWRVYGCCLYTRLLLLLLLVHTSPLFNSHAPPPGPSVSCLLFTLGSPHLHLVQRRLANTLVVPP